MKKSMWAARLGGAVMAVVFASISVLPAAGETVLLRKGADVHLEFDSSLNSKTVQPGARVWFHVKDPVMADGRVIVAAGTKVGSTVEKVHKRGRYGVNATVELQMDSLRTVTGKRIPLRAKTRGHSVGGRTGEAAAATAGGAILLGPIGLVGGLFILGKSVNAHPGDKATVEVARDTNVRIR